MKRLRRGMAFFMAGNLKARIIKDINQSRLAILASIAVAIAFASCTNQNSSKPLSTTSATLNSNPGVPNLTGGTLPGGTTLAPITLINAGPSASSSSGKDIDVQGQNDELGTFCTSADACVCTLTYVVTGTTQTAQLESPITLNEMNLIRCSYSSIPATVSSFQIAIKVVSGGAQSNQLTITTPAVDSSQQTNVANNYLKVTRFQCKDIVQKTTSFYNGGNTSLLDPQSWNMSLSFNFYTTSLGHDYASATKNFECPVSPTDESVVQYSQDRYWPYLGVNDSVGTIGANGIGPRGSGPYPIDARCGDTSSGATSCDCPGGGTSLTSSSFDGQGTAATGCAQNKYTAAVEYNSRSSLFGVTAGLGTTRTATNGLIDGEPYDMALYSVKPLTGYDNVIYPTRIDQGSQTTLGVNNEKGVTKDQWSSLSNPTSFNCTTGNDPDYCKCVTGYEKECRRYQANRHDFYVANFYDATFKYPFCVPHTPGGATGNNSLRLTGALKCNVDTTKSPVVKEEDVSGFVALPDAAGHCPSESNPNFLPKGKKWAQVWHYTAQFPARRIIDIANPGDIGDLFCTQTQKECTNTMKSFAFDDAAAQTSANITTHSSTPTTNNGIGYQYCQTAGGSSSLSAAPQGDIYPVGVLGPQPNVQGYRFGNCLQTNPASSPPGYSNISTQWAGATSTRGQCQWTDGYSPYSLYSDTGTTITQVGGSFRMFNGSVFLPAANPDNPQEPPLPTTVIANAATATTGCYDPAILYFQPYNLAGVLYAGFYNFFVSGSNKGCANFDEGPTATERVQGFSPGTNYQTFDWQGFPFMSGNYTTVATGSGADQAGVGMAGNYCNPTLPGSRWSGPKDTSSGNAWNAGQLAATGDTQPGYDDGIDVWLMGNGAKGACIEADVDKTFGFLYNPTATLDYSAAIGPHKPSNYVNRLPGPNATGLTGKFGYPGLVSLFPKSIKNWFDFVGIGCNGKCDNSSSANSYPQFPWVAGQYYNTGAIGAGAPSSAAPSYAIRSGKHSSTDSWGGYGIFQFNVVDLETVGARDNLYIVTPTGITKSDMENPTIGQQYTPRRYVNGAKIDYALDVDSQNTTTPSDRLSSFPICVLQDSGDN